MTEAFSNAPSEREIVVTRTFNAPRELVFSAWTDPKQMAQWWGPKGFTNPVCEMDVRPGGIWRYVMRSPEGAEYPGSGVFREIIAPERIVYADNGFEDNGTFRLGSLMTVLFEEDQGKTKLTIRSLFETAADRDAILNMGHEEGMGQSLDRLAEILAKA